MLVKVTGTNFVRDTNSMGLINNNTAEKNEYYNKLNMITRQKEEINNVKSEIQNIKDDMQEIKQMLLKLVDKN
jgi:hypothetical protein